LLAHVADRRRGRSPGGGVEVPGLLDEARLREAVADAPATRAPMDPAVDAVADPTSGTDTGGGAVTSVDPQTAADPSSAGRVAGAPGRVLSIEQVSSGVRILRIGRPPSFEYRAGQYMKVGMEGRRSGSFSLASAPHEPQLEFCIERIAGGRLTPAMFTLSVGSQVVLGDRAKGSLHLDPSARTHLLVATATGIAPVRGLVLQALRERVPSRLVILHGASHADELPYADELAALAASHPRLSYLPTVSRPGEARNAGWSGATGRVDEHAIRAASTLDPASTQVLAIGNSGMIANVRTALGGRGFRVDTEAFD
jgi:NAD(P)H-flavin reductase